jgi:hypothetical protein
LREERAALLEQVNEQGVKLEKLLKERSDWAAYFGTREVSRDEVVDVLRNEKKELSSLLFAKTRALEYLLQENERLLGLSTSSKKSSNSAKPPTPPTPLQPPLPRHSLSPSSPPDTVSASSLPRTPVSDAVSAAQVTTATTTTTTNTTVASPSPSSGSWFPVSRVWRALLSSDKMQQT